MDKCRTCKYFRQFNYVFGCAKSERTLFPNRSYADCKDYDYIHNFINDILKKRREEKAKNFFDTIAKHRS